jgi:DNA uptake protein ComE-like DNA-binding protein
MKGLLLLIAAALLLGCTSNTQSTEKTRQESADAAAKLKEQSRQAGSEIKKGAKVAAEQGKAIAEGAREGWNGDSSKKLDVNTASEEQLAHLPGVDLDTAHRIVAERPYHTTEELHTKGVVSEQQWSGIKDRVEVK